MIIFDNHAGFTISDSKLQVVEVVKHKDNFILENADEAYFNEKLNLESDKETKILALLQGAFNEILIKKQLVSKSVSFTLPFELFCTAQLPYDNTLLYSDLLDEIKWELSILYPQVQVKDLVIQYFEIDKNEIVDRNTILIVAIQRKYLKIIDDFCRSNNLKLKFVDNIHFASEKALAINNPLTEKQLVLSIFFSNNFLSVIYSLKGKLIYYRSIPLTGAAELSKYILEEVSPEKIIDINEAFITGNELSASIVESLKKSTGINFNYFNPFEKIKPAPDMLDNKCYLEKFNSFSPAAGIAYRI